MTTPPTTAGWYPDPDGSGGQRYWDGAEWTAQRPDAPETTEETSAWPAELPPWPEDMEMPSWEDAGKGDIAEQPEVSEPAEVPEHAAGPALIESEPAESVSEIAEPEAVEPEGAEPQAGEPEAIVTAEREPAEPVAPAVSDPSEQTTNVVHLVDQPTAAGQLSPERPAESSSTPGRPLKGYLIGIGALLVVLAGVLVWAFAFADPGTGTTEATGTDGASETAETAGSATDSADPAESTSAAPTGGGAQVVDGDVTITSNGVEITPTVVAAENELLTKSASGEFVVVRLTLLNNGELPASFLADQQVLTAGGQTFNPETESTFYLGGISAVLYPGQPVDVAFAFDVPPGTAPESLQVHGDLASPGAVLPLS